MEKQTNQANIREVKLNIRNEFVLNLVTYFTRNENFVFVGNESEIWLENLNHPKIQLIYINDQKEMSMAHATYINQKSQIIVNQIKRKFLMPKVQALVINTCEFDEMVTDRQKYGFIINVQDSKQINMSETLTRLFPYMVKVPFDKSMEEIVKDLQTETKQRATREIQLTKNKFKPIVNYLFIGIIVLFFVYLWLRSQVLPPTFVAIHYGATYNPLIVNGEVWRLIVAAFMHIDPFHLMFNAMFIYRFGEVVESIFGKWRMVVVMILSAMCASLFGFAFSTNFSLGASGIAYGFMGVMVFLGFEMRKAFMPFLKKSIMPLLLINIFLTLFIPNIDHWGHLGGFIGGFLAATAVGVPHIKPFKARTVLTLVTILIMFSGLWISGFRITAAHDFDNFNRAIINQYYQMGNTRRANSLSEIFFGGSE